jgi:hypothetical protein
VRWVAEGGLASLCRRDFARNALARAVRCQDLQSRQHEQGNVAQMQLPQHCRRGFAVQPADVPVFMLQDQFAREKIRSAASLWITSASLVSSSMGSVPKARQDFAARVLLLGAVSALLRRRSRCPRLSA